MSPQRHDRGECRIGRSEGLCTRHFGALLVLLLAWSAVVAPVSAQTPAPNARPADGTTPFDGQIASLMTQVGIQPIEPASPAADFRLPDVVGGERTLSSFAGRWVVLTFLASWCGPCVSEMPTLETLSNALGDRGVEVVGVSVDQDRAALDRFLERVPVTFPVLWDQASTVGRTYRASSIPVSYVIDPLGRITGVSRGARDWGILAPLFEQLVGLLPPRGDGLSYYDPQLTQIELPIRLTPPTGRIAAAPQTARVGEAFSMDVEVHWAGDFEEYLLHPPQVQLPEGVEQRAMSASTSGAAGSRVVTYHVELSADRSGSFALDPVELRFTPRFGGELMTSRLEGPTVDVAAGGMSTPVQVAVGAGGLALVGLLVVGARRLRVRDASPDASAGLTEEVGKGLQEVRRARMEGRARDAYLALADLAAKLPLEGGDHSAPVGESIEEVRFGGREPTREQLDTLERWIERRLSALRPDPDEAAKEVLDLS